MQVQPKKYYAKLLLYGEYTVVKGGHALACPIRNFSGQWVWNGGDATKQYELPAFLNYLQRADLHRSIALQKFGDVLSGRAFFDSNIPTGYGVGSSGALCAAVYDAFGEGQQPDSLPILQSDLACLEQFFHGKSSGTDPLISLLDQAVQITPQAGIQPIVLPPIAAPYQFFLIDTKQPRKTAPLVAQFLEKCENPVYLEHLQQQLIPSTHQAIDAYLHADWAKLFAQTAQISAFQLEYFQEMIPTPFRKLWEDGLHANYYSLKLCGAGGGGFILGLTNDLEQLKAKLTNYSIVLPQF